MCRFIMNLRQAGSVESPTSFPVTPDTLGGSGPVFVPDTGFIGDIGNFLDHTPSDTVGSSATSDDGLDLDEIELAAKDVISIRTRHVQTTGLASPSRSDVEASPIGKPTT